MRRYGNKGAAAVLSLAFAAQAFLTGCGGDAARTTEAAAATTEAAVTTAAETTAAAATEAAATTEAQPAGGTSKVAGAADQVEATDVTPRNAAGEALPPVAGSSLKPGDYKVDTECSSSMFRITDCVLTVREDGSMEALLTMSGSGYGYVFPGTGEEAAAADPAEFIPAGESAEGTNTFVFPVEALDQVLPCAAFSKKKEMWYDRDLVFRSDSLPLEAFTDPALLVTAESLGLEDGTYTAEVTLGGGSGRAAVASPARVFVENGKTTAEIIWGSANYDYMKVDGEMYPTEIIDGHSVAVIPFPVFDRNVRVIADTTAMSKPHEITYTLYFDSGTLTEEKQ